jgi:hypothetical protein
MNPPTRNDSIHNADAATAEETLRIIARLPAPEGLEERVKERLRTAPASGRVLHWPASRSGGGWMRSGGMRAAAAAAIVFVVAGGGWGVYSRIQPVAQPKVIAMPAPVNSTGGFQNSGAMRTPQTLQLPVLAHPVVEMPKPNDGAAKSDAKPKHKRNHRAQSSAVEHTIK